mmetsp:Transcript_7148/g.14337  ORF Transcript_7148/g.14337 Transcript_7148/m.14337 type:complete len:177 (+) Transcript_7148:134-664(+)
MAGDKGKGDTSGDTIAVAPDVYFGPIHVNNVGQLRRLQETILPVRYKDSFYTDVVEYSNKGIAKLAYFKDVMVGAACCRLEERDGKVMLYVMTLAVLPAYRGRSIGSKLLDFMIEKAKELGAAGIFLHVWTENKEGIEFYRKKFDFEEKETIEGYYKRLDPPNCLILEKIFPTAEE